MLKYTIHLNNNETPSDPKSITASGYNVNIEQGVLIVVERDPDGRPTPRIVCAVPVTNISHVESAAE